MVAASRAFTGSALSVTEPGNTTAFGRDRTISPVVELTAIWLVVPLTLETPAVILIEPPRAVGVPLIVMLEF